MQTYKTTREGTGLLMTLWGFDGCNGARGMKVLLSCSRTPKPSAGFLSLGLYGSGYRFPVKVSM